MACGWRIVPAVFVMLAASAAIATGDAADGSATAQRDGRI